MSRSCSPASRRRWSAWRRRRRTRRISPPPRRSSGAPRAGRSIPSRRVNRVDLALLKGVDRQRDMLLANTSRFAQGLPANNALLWGARGMGKSSLVKSVHGALAEKGLKLIEIHREDIEALPALLGALAQAPFRFIVFCDDLSFDGAETSYKALKTALEGGVEGRPRQCAVLRHVESPPSVAARHDGE